ncbi:MAG: AraC family transcriptional regulator [Oscillospiraceae bacterium]|jgi:AraC-like DNA-binding protein|nr:AraC family transcriptional regulator [Oscillospiraceae bacterium]
MIKKLEGIHKTVDYDAQSLFILHHNAETDDYPGHWHSAAEIIMPLKGGYDVSVNDIPYHLEEKDIIIIPTGDIHELRAPKTMGERMILQFDLSLLKSVKGLAGASFIFFKPWLITAADSPELHGILRVLLLEALDEYREKRDYYEAEITAKLISIAVFMARKQREDVPGAFADQLIKRKAHIVNFNRCVEYINQHYKDDLSLEYVSSIAGFSKFHFTRWFKQFAGMSFYEYLTQVRIKVAESMLADSEAPITEIALESGFQSIATFNRVFKYNKKLTPTEFRNMRNKNN